MIAIIVAVAKNGTIGNDNDLPWHLPTDMKMFKEVTQNSTVVMGRKCWESIPEKYRPLPNRTNVVLSRNPEYIAEGAHAEEKSLLTALSKCDDQERDVFIIGGAQLYAEAFKFADRVYLTRIHEDVEDDIKLIGFNPDEWVKDTSTGIISENGHTFTFEQYQRKL